MSVSVISQRYLLHRFSTKHCNTKEHVTQCSTSKGVSAFYRQPRMRGGNLQINKRLAQGQGRRCQRTVLSLGQLTKKGGSETKDLRPDLLDEFVRYNEIVGTTLPNARTTIRGHHTLPLLIRRKALEMTHVTMA